MQSAAEAVPSGMASVLGLTLEQVEQVCNEARLPNEILLPANLLCPGNIAVSGHLASIDAVSALAEKAGAIKTIRLPVAGAFHTEIMRPAEKRLSEAIHDVAMHPLRVPLFSNVDAQPHVQPEEFQRLLPTQLVSPVQWEASLRAMISAGIKPFYRSWFGESIGRHIETHRTQDGLRVRRRLMGTGSVAIMRPDVRYQLPINPLPCNFCPTSINERNVRKGKVVRDS